MLFNGEVVFFFIELFKLDEMINRLRWVVFVFFKGELEVFLEVFIKFCRVGMSLCICFCLERDNSFMGLGFFFCSLWKINRSIFM